MTEENAIRYPSLLQALAGVLDGRTGIRGARIAHFVFADGVVVEGDKSAFLSEIPTEELVPMLEDWCRWAREELLAEKKVVLQ